MDAAVVAARIRLAEALQEEAKSLGVRMTREVERLRECCKLWCVCRQPYNEERPMLACDYCNDWFHYDCVGLRAPSEDEDDDDVAPQDYCCPHCTAKVIQPVSGQPASCCWDADCRAGPSSQIPDPGCSSCCPAGSCACRRDALHAAKEERRMHGQTKVTPCEGTFKVLLAVAES